LCGENQPPEDLLVKMVPLWELHHLPNHQLQVQPPYGTAVLYGKNDQHGVTV
jgi:hypothetical protein